jgi:hypothetical protein
MKLNYGYAEDIKALSYVLRRKAQRIEFHILARDVSTYILISYSGSDNALPSKQKVQGPFHSKDQAQSAVSAIANALKVDDYETSEEHTIWAIQAQHAARSLRLETSSASGDYSFDPQDVYFNKPDG